MLSRNASRMHHPLCRCPCFCRQACLRSRWSSICPRRLGTGTDEVEVRTQCLTYSNRLVEELVRCPHSSFQKCRKSNLICSRYLLAQQYSKESTAQQRLSEAGSFERCPYRWWLGNSSPFLQVFYRRTECLYLQEPRFQGSWGSLETSSCHHGRRPPEKHRYRRTKHMASHSYRVMRCWNSRLPCRWSQSLSGPKGSAAFSSPGFCVETIPGCRPCFLQAPQPCKVPKTQSLCICFPRLATGSFYPGPIAST